MVACGIALPRMNRWHGSVSKWEQHSVAEAGKEAVATGTAHVFDLSLATVCAFDGG